MKARIEQKMAISMPMRRYNVHIKLANGAGYNTAVEAPCEGYANQIAWQRAIANGWTPSTLLFTRLLTPKN